MLRYALLLLCLTLPLAGCGAVVLGGAAAATGTYVYYNDRAIGTFAVGVPAAYEAALAACTEFGIPVTRRTKDDSGATVKGKLSGDDVTISMELVGADLTEISVRIGLMGNESASRRILGSISRRL